MCSTRGGSQGTYITFASAMRIRQPTLPLKPRGDVTRNPKQGYQWPQNRTHVSAKKLLKKKILEYLLFSKFESLRCAIRPFVNLQFSKHVALHTGPFMGDFFAT